MASNVSGIASYPLPPPTLDADGKALWNEIVRSLQPGYFLQSEHPVLETYVQGILSIRRHREMLKIEGDFPGGKLNRRHMLLQSEIKSMTGLATRLRLCPQSRLDRMMAGKATRPPARAAHDVSPEEDEQLQRYGL